ncbi:hypothetical protein PHAVU_001G070300 [Phaseolus vulgaris]|uniref:tRNA-guanine(15) transglycosylase-like domain-containing protein n=1 Tax=Phaseolus vulgaris TaxID=3885 RepID=V7CVN9_PHAVU|nr:hypothetical protein PHAVU_001G070300g [Phaseolus vulgaris]ESW33448.1 hypothetical protein PHAVU_001G070300g [Phaseolus vulgaris]
MYRTLRWIDRCIAAHKRPHDQNLFGIVQGGLDPILRDICAKGLVEHNLPERALGADMYDCVYPTRTTRFGTALIPEGVLKLKHKAMADDTHPIDPTCPCMVCKNYTRAYIQCRMDSRAKINSPRLRTLMSAIHQKGYAASRSHIATNAIKTNFPMTECIKIAKELLQVSIA